MAMIPTLETQRLLLRPHRPGDLEVCTAMWGDPLVTRYIGGKSFTREEVWARLLRYAGHWKWLGFGYWAIEEAATGRFLGEIGLANFKRDTDPPLEDLPEAGWVLTAEARGHGFATESLRAVVAWHDGRSGAREIACLIHPDNAASMRVAVKCGFAETRRASYKGNETVIFVRGSCALP